MSRSVAASKPRSRNTRAAARMISSRRAMYAAPPSSRAALRRASMPLVAMQAASAGIPTSKLTDENVSIPAGAGPNAFDDGGSGGEEERVGVGRHELREPACVLERQRPGLAQTALVREQRVVAGEHDPLGPAGVGVVDDRPGGMPRG